MSTGSLTHGRTFESIEDLLEVESPQWAVARMDQLMARLTQLAGIADSQF
jgi:hypothetical protein